jgi:hypothetical protein
METTHRLHHAFARPLGPHVDVEVVGVAHERVTALLQLFVHVVQQHVRQERRQRPALWRALVTLHHHPVRENPRVEVAANEPQHATVLDPLREPPHEHVVVHTIEELLQIDVHDPAATLLHVALRVTHGVVRAAPRPEAVAVLREARIDSRLQDLQQGLLDEAVEHRRDAELALASAGARTPAPSDRSLLGARVHSSPTTLPRSRRASGLHPSRRARAPVAWTSAAMRLRDSWAYALLSVRSFAALAGRYYDLC